jgi:small conductance mechanosensitive channel
MENVVARLQEWTALYGLEVVGALIILVVGYWIARAIRTLLAGIMRKAKTDETLTSFVCSLSYVALLTFVVIAALGKLGIPTASFIAVVGAAGLAVGLALQGALANFAAGVLMVIFKPIKVDDFVEVAGVTGIVEDIEIFTTQLRTPDNKTIIVPNGKVMGDSITNFTAKDCRRIDLVIGVSYADDLDKVKQVLEGVLAADARVLKEPAPMVGVLEMADSSVNFVVRPWVKTPEYWDLYFDLQKAIKQRFDAERISIPFPQQDVHLYKHDAQAG